MFIKRQYITSNYLPYQPLWSKYSTIIIILACILLFCTIMYLLILFFSKKGFLERLFPRKGNAQSKTNSEDNDLVSAPDKSLTEMKSKRKLSRNFIIALSFFIGIFLYSSSFSLIIGFADNSLMDSTAITIVYTMLLNPLLLLIAFIVVSSLSFKNFKERLTIFLLFLIPVFATFVSMLFFVTIDYYNDILDLFQPMLGCFIGNLFLLLLLQTPLLLSKKSFVVFYGLKTDPEPPTISPYKTQSNSQSQLTRLFRIIGFILFCIISIVIIVFSFFTLYQDAFSVNLSDTLVVFFSIIIAFLIFYFWFNFTFLFQKTLHSAITLILGIIIPIAFYFILLLLSRSQFQELDYAFNFDWSMIKNGTSLLLSYLFYTVFFLLYSIPIGFVSKSRTHYLIIASLHAITWLCLMLIIGDFIPEFETYSSFKILDIFYILQIPTILAVLFIGSYWGYYLKSMNKMMT